MSIQKTTHYNLDLPSRGSLNWDKNLNNNFDKIDTELKKQQDKDIEQDNRINTILNTPIDGTVAAQMVTDMKTSTRKNKVFATPKDRFEEIEEEIAGADYSEPVEVTQSVISLPSTSTEGQVSVGLKGNTRTNLLSDNSTEWENGTISTADGSNTSSISNRLRTKNYIPCEANKTYSNYNFNTEYSTSRIHWYDSNKKLG